MYVGNDSYCPHYVDQGSWNGRVFFCTIDRQHLQRTAGLLLSAQEAGNIARYLRTHRSGKCVQCHVDSRRTVLNRFIIAHSVEWTKLDPMRSDWQWRCSIHSVAFYMFYLRFTVLQNKQSIWNYYSKTFNLANSDASLFWCFFVGESKLHNPTHT